MGCARSDAALARIAGVHMDVGYNCHVLCAANSPKHPKILAVEAHDAGVKAMRIEIIIRTKSLIRAGPFACEHGAEQERAAFSALVPPRSRSRA